jgi:predicted peptidase
MYLAFKRTALVLLVLAPILLFALPVPADQNQSVTSYVRPPAPTIALPTSPGDHPLKFKTHIGDKTVQMSYLLHLPADYGNARVKSPVLVFLHGIGECGDDLAGIYGLGPMTLLKANGGNEAFAASCPYIVLCPQCPAKGQQWSDDFMFKAVAELVEQTVKNTRCDPDRVYITGLSMGGIGTWCVAEEDPAVFAAAAPLSAMKWTPELAADKLKHVAVWAIAGANDEGRFVDGTRQMEAALKNSDPGTRFTYLVNTGHEAFIPCYQNPQFYEWFLSHRRSTESKKPDTAPPVFPTAPGHYLLTFVTKIGDQPWPLDYVLYIPKPVKDAAPGPHPAMLFLHEQDTMGPDYHDICVHGPDLVLEKNPALQNNFPFVVISPRLPIKCDWQTQGMKEALVALVDHVNQSLPLDPDRLIVTGVNAGANAAWRLADAVPDKFTAVAVTSTDPSFNYPGDPSVVMKRMPGRIYVKSNNKPVIDRFMQIKGQTKLDWKLINAVPISAGPVTEVPMYGDHAFLTWAAAVKRAGEKK